MTVFALVHGAFHGAWCWSRLVPELQARGHDAVTMDLPIDDVDATWADYADVVVRALEGVDEPVVVGHSLAGLVIPLVAERRPVRALVYLCALVPKPGWTVVDDGYPGVPSSLLHPTLDVDEGGRGRFPADAARAVFYHCCDDQAVVEALANLRPQAPIWTSPWALDTMPNVASHSIVCADDRMLNPEWSRLAAIDRLGVDPIELPGDHSPFFGLPAELADVLSWLAPG